MFVVTGFEKAKDNEKYLSIPYLTFYHWGMDKRQQPEVVKKIKLNNKSFKSRYYYPEIISKNGKDIYFCTVNNKIEEK